MSAVVHDKVKLSVAAIHSSQWWSLSAKRCQATGLSVHKALHTEVRLSCKRFTNAMHSVMRLVNGGLDGSMHGWAREPDLIGSNHMKHNHHVAQGFHPGRS